MRHFKTEYELIEKIKVLTNTESDGVLAGIGDDAAVMARRKSGARLLTTDLLVEGVHFDPAYASLYDIGRKALAVNLSDIAAMGGVPTVFVLSLGIPDGTTPVRDLMGGLLDEARRAGVHLVGGDVSASGDRLVINIALEGVCPVKEIAYRSGARPSDGIYLLGTPGRSGLGLELLRRGWRIQANTRIATNLLEKSASRLRKAAVRAIRAHLRPVALVAQGRKLAKSGCLSAMIDTSDGLSRDVGNLCRASGVGAEIELDCLPIRGDDRELADRVGVDFVELVLHAGEDYGLLFTVPRGKTKRLLELGFGPIPLRRIGTITQAKEKVILTARGKRPRRLQDRGWDHFAH